MTMKYSSSSGNYGSLIMLALAALLVLELTTTFASAYPARYSAYYASIPLEEQLIERIKQAFIEDNDLENSKRGIDLGLGRGFSGSQAAKHLMGLAAANFAGGPGRRRRSDGEA
uniref:Diuretic hormone class 2 n=1 Tax=Dendroctonus ponderosae TaxID=77166 RepID=A0AAR5Q2N1_DENPD